MGHDFLLNPGSPKTAASVDDLAIIRSKDKGVTWDKHATIATRLSFTSVVDENGKMVRTAGDFPVNSATVVRNNGTNSQDGNIYIAFETGLLRTDGHAQIGLVGSTDGGLSWSPQMKASQLSVSGLTPTQAQAFTPVVTTLTVNGVTYVAVMYYDFRNIVSGGPANTDTWLALFKETATGTAKSSLVFKGETRLTDSSFDMRLAPLTGLGHFVGEYEGLTAHGSDVFSAFVVTNNITLTPPFTMGGAMVDDNNRTDVVFRKVTITP
jgi:hypothetical protein